MGRRGAPVFRVRDGAAPLGVGGLKARAAWVEVSFIICEAAGGGRVGSDLENEIVGRAAPMKILIDLGGS